MKVTKYHKPRQNQKVCVAYKVCWLVCCNGYILWLSLAKLIFSFTVVFSQRSLLSIKGESRTQTKLTDRQETSSSHLLLFQFIHDFPTLHSANVDLQYVQSRSLCYLRCVSDYASIRLSSFHSGQIFCYSYYMLLFYCPAAFKGVRYKYNTDTEILFDLNVILHI